MPTDSSAAVLDKTATKPYIVSSTAEPVFFWALDYLQRISLKGNERLLDIGCRDGRVTTHLAELYPEMEIVAIECNKELATAAAKAFKPYGKRVKVVDADATNVMVTRPFDVILSFSTLHWIDDKGAAISNIAKGLVPNGKAYLQFFASHGRKRFDDYVFDTIHQPDWASHFENSNASALLFHEVDPIDFELLIQRNGLETVSAEFVRQKLTFADRNIFANWLLTWVQSLQLLPRALHPAFIEAVVDQYLLKNPPNKDGEVQFSDYILELELQKLPSSLDDISSELEPL